MLLFISLLVTFELHLFINEQVYAETGPNSDYLEIIATVMLFCPVRISHIVVVKCVIL